MRSLRAREVKEVYEDMTTGETKRKESGRSKHSAAVVIVKLAPTSAIVCHEGP